MLKVAYKECAILLYDAIKEIQYGTFRRIVQNKIHPTGFYCGKREKGDEIINWDQPSRILFNFIRGINLPGPMATTFLKGEMVRINKAKLIKDVPNYIGIPGQLLLKTKNGFLIKTKDSFLEIFEIESDTKLKVGDRLGK